MTGQQGDEESFTGRINKDDTSDMKMKGHRHPRQTAAEQQPEIEQLKKELEEEKEKAEKYLDQWQRTQADFDNYRKRTEQEKGDVSQNTTCSVLAGILPVMDDLDRALAAVPEDSSKLPWVDGIKLIYKKFHSILESMGVEEVCALGQPFDPALHEAVAHLEGDEGKVINEIQKGYRLKDKLVRPSKVVVGKGFD